MRKRAHQDGARDYPRVLSIAKLAMHPGMSRVKVITLAIGAVHKLGIETRANAVY